MPSLVQVSGKSPAEVVKLPLWDAGTIPQLRLDLAAKPCRYLAIRSEDQVAVIPGLW